MKHCYRILILAVIFLSLAPNANGQVIILNELDSTRIEFVGISDQSFSRSTISDENGIFDLGVFRIDDSLYFNHISFEPTTIAFKDITDRIFLHPRNHHMDHVTVSYTKWADESESIQSGVASLNTRDIEISNAQTSADLLASTGQIFVQKSQQGGGSPMIRGFAANRLLYSIDGIRMNNAIFRGGNLHNVISIDPMSLAKVEVLLGSYSVIYGSDAIGGVMNFTTLPARFGTEENNLGIEGMLRYSSANQEKTGHVKLNLSKKNIAYVGTFSRSDFSHMRMGKHGPEEYLRPFYTERINGQDTVLKSSDSRIQSPSSLDQWSTLQKLRWRIEDDWTLSYTFYHSQSSKFGRFDRHLRMSNGNPRYGRWDYGPMSWSMHHLNTEYSNNNFFLDRIKLSLAYQVFEESRITRNFNAREEFDRKEQVKAYSINVDALKRISTHSKVYYGIEGVLNDVNSRAFATDIIDGTQAEAMSRYPKAEWQSSGAYISVHSEWRNKHHLRYGLRYNFNQVSATFDPEYYPVGIEDLDKNISSLTGNIAYRRELNSSNSISLNFSTGFRAPNIDDVAKVFDSEPGSVIVPNTDLKPEYAYNFELAWHSNVENLRTEISGFYTFLDRVMVRRDFLFNGQDSILYDGVLSKVQALQNANQANVYGFQFYLESDFLSAFSSGIQLNYQKGEEEDFMGIKSPMRHAAPAFGSLWLNYQLKRIEIIASWQFQDEVEYSDLAISERSKVEIYAQDGNGNPYSPSWNRFDLKANWEISENYQAQVGIENIFDQRYRPYSSGIAGLGRNFVISLRGKWF